MLCISGACLQGRGSLEKHYYRKVEERKSASEQENKQSEFSKNGELWLAGANTEADSPSLFPFQISKCGSPEAVVGEPDRGKMEPICKTHTGSMQTKQQV